jgi:amino acid transporter
VRGPTTPIAIFLAVVALTIAFALVTSISSLALPARPPADTIGDLPDTTPTPAEAPLSTAGSTDGIVWMGVVIAVIVVLPLLATRALWHTQR